MSSRSSSRTRSMISGVLGNLLEWYDFTVYGFFAVQIGASLLGNTGDGGTLAAFMIFAVGFLARPFGGALLTGEQFPPQLLMKQAQGSQKRTEQNHRFSLQAQFNQQPPNAG